jgi:ribose-phosphate pyrophosphokinase
MQIDRLTVLSIAPLIAKAIQEVFTDGSVESLFENTHHISGALS